MSTQTPNWADLLDDLDKPPLGTVAETLADATGMGINSAYDSVEAAVDDGELIEDTETSALGVIRLPDADDSSDLNQQSDTDEKALEAFADAVEFFHKRLDTDVSAIDAVEFDTPREAFRDGRGWADETIDEKRLGWAPASDAALLDYLMQRGYNREAILGTGLFWDSLEPVWKGRLVIPYTDEQGRPAFAISRRAGEGHPADRAGDYGDGPAKYHKLPVNAIDECELAEPIYGRDTIEAGEPVLITEGVADAITAHQAGYPCVSPVTTSFKLSDRERLVELLADVDVSRVYVVNDAEPATSSLRDAESAEGWGRLHTEQFGEGVRGAVRTASYLDDHGVDVRIGELPQPAAEKVDLDDYLSRWDGDLRPILAGARRVDDHPAYDPKDMAIEAATSSRGWDGSTSTDSRGSELYNLGIEDASGLDWDYRGENPLGHHGDSENYFVLVKEHEVAYDYKYKTAYNALTYLLVEAGERDASNPNGSLDGSEHFAVWQHAKDERLIPDDDPIPRRALQHVAREATDWDGNLVEHETRDGDTFEGLPTDVYNATLAAIEEDYGLNHGRASSTTTGDYNDTEPVATLPLEKLGALSPDEQKRAARKRGANIPSTRDARQRLRDGVFRELRAGNKTVLDAPTALGKSYTVASEPWLNRESTTGGAPVIHLHQTREARDEAASTSEVTGVQYAVLLGRKEASPVARGDHDPTPEGDENPDIVVTIDGEPASEWFDRMCDGKGLPFSTALAIARQRNDQGLDELPPFGQEDPAVAQWDGLPRTDGGEPAVDVLHATHQFAHVPSIRAHTNVVIDEQPDFTEELSQDAIRRMVNAYLKEIGAPVSNFEAFVMLAENVGVGGDLGKERDALHSKLKTDREVSTEWFVENADAHALAPGITRAVWDAICWEDLDRNGRRSATVHHDPPRFDSDHDGYNAGLWLSVVIDEDHTVRTVRATPDFSNTRSVIGLDAHPSMPMWQLNADEDMTTDAVLDPEERRVWRRFERGLRTVQVGEATRPRSGEKALEWMNDQRVRTLLERIREHHGDGFKTALSTIQTERRVRELLADVCGSVVDDESTMHFGEEKSRNDFADERAGYVYGCMDPGDEMILNAIAELGLDAAAPMVETDDGDLVREKGRTFEGRDADTADALLASVRENHVAQAAGRYARNADDPDSRATVYIHTDAAPSGFVDVEVGGVEWLATDLQRDVVATLSRRQNATAKELAEAVDCSKRHVQETLERLEENGLVERDRRAGKHGADVYHGDSVDDAIVDLGETANDDLTNPNRWSLVVCSPNARDTPPDRASTVGDDVGSDHTAGDTPPDWSFADD